MDHCKCIWMYIVYCIGAHLWIMNQHTKENFLGCWSEIQFDFRTISKQIGKQIGMNFGGLKLWKYGGGREALQKHRSVSERFWSRIHQRPISFPTISSSSSQICRLRVLRGGGFFRSHQYVRRHSRIRNLLSSWELPNMAGNSLNVPNGGYFIFYKM